MPAYLHPTGWDCNKKRQPPSRGLARDYGVSDSKRPILGLHFGKPARVAIHDLATPSDDAVVIAAFARMVGILENLRGRSCRLCLLETSGTTPVVQGRIRDTLQQGDGTGGWDRPLKGSSSLRDEGTHALPGDERFERLKGVFQVAVEKGRQCLQGR